MKTIKIEVEAVEMEFTKYIDFFTVYIQMKDGKYKEWARFLKQEAAEKECKMLQKAGNNAYVARHSIFV